MTSRKQALTAGLVEWPLLLNGHWNGCIIHCYKDKNKGDLATGVFI